MLVAIKKDDNGNYITVDNLTYEVKIVKEKSSEFKSSLKYAVAETETHFVGIGDSKVSYMLANVSKEFAEVIKVNTLEVEKISISLLEDLISNKEVGNIKHINGLLENKYYTCRFKKSDNVRVRVEFEDTMEKEDYLRKRVILEIVEHNSDYTKIKSIDKLEKDVFSDVYLCIADGDKIELNKIGSNVTNDEIKYIVEYTLRHERNK